MALAHCAGKRILILGGSGYMGKALCSRLLAAGASVTLVNRGQTADEFGEATGLTRLRADRDDRASFRAALTRAGDVDCAIDFSAFNPSHVADAVGVLAGHVAHYIFISTNSVYQSDQHSDEAYDEAEAFDLPVPAAARSAYGWDKRGAEEVLVAAHAAGAFPATRLRIPAICGPGDPTQRWLRYHLWIQSGHPVYSLKGAQDPSTGREPSYSACYSLDVVQAVLLAMQKGAPTFGKAYHICGKERLTIPQLVRIMAASAGRPAEEGRSVLLTPSQASQLSEQERGMLAAWNPFDGANRQASTVKANLELGWVATPIEEWMRETVEWFLTPGQQDESSWMVDSPFLNQALMAKWYSNPTPP